MQFVSTKDHITMPNTALTLDQFRTDMLAADYDEVLERTWAPDTVIGTHTHPFDANAIVAHGEMWLAAEGASEQHLQPGDRFHLLANVPHKERYGAAGATYWVARRNAAAQAL
jgi:hypothetical protein